MLKGVVIAPIALMLGACGGAAPPTRSNAQSFEVISEQKDPAARSITLNIKVSGPATTPNVKSVAESVIASRSSEYQQITVNSFVDGMPAGEGAFAVSRLDRGVVSHKFSALAESQKIPTH